MKFFTSQRSELASRSRYLLCLVITAGLAMETAIANDNATPYQSTFDDYKITIKDIAPQGPHDSSSAKQEHQMHGTQHTNHNMRPEAMDRSGEDTEKMMSMPHEHHQASKKRIDKDHAKHQQPLSKGGSHEHAH